MVILVCSLKLHPFRFVKVVVVIFGLLFDDAPFCCYEAEPAALMDVTIVACAIFPQFHLLLSCVPCDVTRWWSLITWIVPPYSFIHTCVDVAEKSAVLSPHLMISPSKRYPVSSISLEVKIQ